MVLVVSATVAGAAQLPSVFRGVVVTDSPVGVRVVSVDAASQAAMADLRPEDVIVRINDAEVHTIDEFSVLSQRLKGEARTATVVVFRNGKPQELALHLYSYPVLREWGVEFVPEHDVRFAQPGVGRGYWVRLGQGFEEAGKPGEALNAYLNALHNVPGDAEAGVKAAVLASAIGRRQLRENARARGAASLRRGVVMMHHAFDFPLTDDQLAALKQALVDTLAALRDLKTRQPSSMIEVSRRSRAHG